MAVVNEIVTEFSFKGDSAPLDSFNENLSTSISVIAGFGAATVAAAGAFAAWTGNILGGLDPMIQLSRSTGVAVESIQALGYAASVNGSSAQAMESTIESLSQTIGNAALNGDENFSRLGISVRKANGEVKNADEVLMDVNKRFNQLGLSMQEKQSMAASLGIDPSLVQLLSKTGEEINALTDEAKQFGVITKEQAGDAAAFNDSLTTLKFAFSGIQNQIAVGFGPELKALADQFLDFLKANQDLIKDGISWLGEALTTLAGTVTRLAPIFGIMIAGFVAAKIAALGFGGVMGIVLSPVVLITAGIVALLLIIDDLIVAFQGGQSVIADFFQEFLGVDIVAVMTEIWDTVKTVFDSIAQYFTDLFNDPIGTITAQFEEMANKLFSFFTGIFSSLGEMALNILPDWAADLLGLDSAPSPSESLPESQTMQNGTSGNTSNSISQDVNINVTSPNPEAAGVSVRDNLQSQLDNAQTQVSRGGR